jgi:hypothetical protein
MRVRALIPIVNTLLGGEAGPNLSTGDAFEVTMAWAGNVDLKKV